MTENFNKTGFYKVDHTKFGGIIYLSDFNTDYKGKNNTNGSAIAKRIANDERFDAQCNKNILNNKNYGGNKNVKSH